MIYPIIFVGKKHIGTRFYLVLVEVLRQRSGLLKMVHAKDKKAETALRISIDVKAAVRIGLFSRKGKSRISVHAMTRLEQRFERLGGLEKWFVTISHIAS